MLQCCFSKAVTREVAQTSFVDVQGNPVSEVKVPAGQRPKKYKQSCNKGVYMKVYSC